MKSRKYVPGILVDGRGLRGPKGEKGDAGFALSDLSSILTSYITNLTDYADLTHIHGVAVGTNITAVSASSGLSLSVGNYLTTAAASDHSHSDLITGAALSSHIHGSIYTVSKTGSLIANSSGSSGLTLSVPNYLTTAANSYHSHSELYIPLANSASYQLTANNSLSAYSSHTHGVPQVFGNITVGSSSNAAVYSVAERLGRIVIGGNTLGTSAVISAGTVLLAGEGIISLSQNGNSISIIGSAAGAGAGTGFTTGAAAGATVTGALGVGGLLLGIPAYLTTARNSTDAIGLATAITGGSMTGNSLGLSIDLPAYLTTAALSANTSNYAGIITGATNCSVTANTSGISVKVGDYITTGMLSNANTSFIGLATAATDVTWTADSRGISLNASGYLNRTEPYIPQITLSGNTDGVLAGISSGTMTLLGGNNITLSQDGNSVKIIGTAGHNITLASNITSGGATGYVLMTGGVVTVAGGDNITLSQDGHAYTIIGAASGTDAGIAFSISSSNTSGTASLIQAGTLYMEGGSNITVSQNSNTIKIVGAAVVGAGSGTTIDTTTGDTLKITLNTDGLNLSYPNWLTTAMQSTEPHVRQFTLSGNTAGVLAAVNSGTVTLHGGNNITLSQNGNDITISGPTLVGVQTGISGIAGSFASTVTAGTVQFANANGISFGLNSNTMTASWQSTNYVLTAVSSLLQPVANSTLSLGTGYSSHTHGSNVYIGGITGSQFKFTSSSNYLSMGIPSPLNILISGNTSGTPYVISGFGDSLTLVGGNNITLNQLGKYIYIHGETASGAAVTHTHGSAPSMTGGIGITSNSSAWSISIPDFLTTAANSTHIHGLLNTTNINGTSASSGLSLSVPVGSVYFSNVATNNITFGSAVSGSSTTITAIAGGGTGGTGGAGGAALMGSGTYSQNSGTVRFVNANGISWDLSANSMYASMSHGSISFNNGSGVTFGTAGAGLNTTVTASVSHGTIAYNNTNGVSFGTTAAGLNTTVTASINRGNIYYQDASGVSWGSSVNSVSTTIAASVNIGYLFFSNVSGHSWSSSVNGVSTSVYQITA